MTCDRRPWAKRLWERWAKLEARTCVNCLSSKAFQRDVAIDGRLAYW